MVEIQTKAAPQQVRNRLFELTRYPWLDSVSDDRATWAVRDLVGQRKRTARIDLNIEFQDGTRLTDPVNRALFELAVEYVELVRLYQPEMNATTHQVRATRLLLFLYWLTQRGVRSLKDVTQNHLTLFLQNLEFGTEWVLEMPHRLIRYMQREVQRGNELPLNSNGKIDLRKIFRQERIHWLDCPSSQGLCHRIRQWVEAHPGELDTQASPEELIERMGWKPKPLTGKYIAQMVKPIEEIWAWRDDFRPDIETAALDAYGITKKARLRGAKPGHYATIPSEIAFPYLRGALQWVVTFAPIFLEGQQRQCDLEKTRKRLAKAGLDIELTRRTLRMTPDQVTPDRFLRLTAAACFVVIAGLSARRIGEIMDLGAHCTFVDMDGHPWIRIYIEKTLRTYEQMPVPAAVHQAVECLEEISAEAREETGDDSLWQYRSRYKRRCVRLRPNLELNSLSRFLGGDLHERWRFHPHQFRRFFAMVYFWRYEPGDVAALAHHLRHFDLEMTRQYVIDDGFSRIWQDVAEERQRDVLASVVGGSRWIGGPAVSNSRRASRGSSAVTDEMSKSSLRSASSRSCCASRRSGARPASSTSGAPSACVPRRDIRTRGATRIARAPRSGGRCSARRPSLPAPDVRTRCTPRDSRLRRGRLSPIRRTSTRGCPKERCSRTSYRPAVRTSRERSNAARACRRKRSKGHACLTRGVSAYALGRATIQPAGEHEQRHVEVVASDRDR